MEGDPQKIKPKELWSRFKMLINRAYRYELKPNIAQRILLAKHAGAAGFTYNWGLSQRIASYEKDKSYTNAIEQHRILNSLKEESFPWMYEVSKCAPQEALRDLDRAFQNFFRTIKQGKKIGFPKFKRKGIHDHFRLTGTIKVNKKSVQLPRLGVIRLKEETQVEGRILSTTISRQADRWYVSLTVELELPMPKPIEGKKIGLDLGLTAFITTSDGEKISAPKPLKQSTKKLGRLSRQHSRKRKGSNNRKKSALRLARAHRKISNQRMDFHHKLSTQLAKTKSTIVVEDLDVKSMQQERRLSKGIADAGWGGFLQMLEYKSKWYGAQLIQAPQYYPSSKICSSCHDIAGHMPLHIRNWQCEKCGSSHDRDINAAKNLLNLSTESSSGIYACRDPSCGIGHKPISNGSLKQELMNGIFVHKL
jgi:putative transposase